MYQEGYITVSKCSKCGEIFPIFTFVADTDMVTSGCVALTGKDKSIVLAMYRSNESIGDIENRVGSSFKIVGERYEEMLEKRYESFQEFVKESNPIRVIYTCIYCGADTSALKTETKEEFLLHGKIKVLDLL